MAKSKGLRLEDLIAAQRELAQQGDPKASAQLDRLEGIAAVAKQQLTIEKEQVKISKKIADNQPPIKLAKQTAAIAEQDRVLQAAQLFEDRNSDKKLDTVAKKLDGIDHNIKRGVIDKTGDGLNSNVIYLVDAVKKLNFTARATSQPGIASSPNSPTVARPIGYPGMDPKLGERLGEEGFRYARGGRDWLSKMYGFKMPEKGSGIKGWAGAIKDSARNMFSLENMVDIDVDGEHGLFGGAIAKRIKRNQYIKDRRDVDGADAKSLKQYKEDYARLNKLRGDIAENEREIETKLDRGMSTEELQKAGYYDRRVQFDEELKRLDPSYRNRRAEDARAAAPLVVEPTPEPTPATPVEPVSEALAVQLPDATPAPIVPPMSKRQQKKMMAMSQRRRKKQLMARMVADQEISPSPPSPATVAEAVPPPEATTPDNSSTAQEVQEESLRLAEKHLRLLEKIEENTRPTAKGVAADKVEPVPAENGGSLLDKLTDMVPGGLGKMFKKSGARGMFGRAAGAVLPWVAPAAIAYGAANAADAAAGAFGVGKDKEGNDLKIDTKQDDANWNKMSWWQKAESGLARGVEKVGSFVGFDNFAREAQATRIQKETDYLNKATQAGNVTPASRADVRPSTAGSEVYNRSADVAATGGRSTSAPVVVNAPTSTNIQQNQTTVSSAAPRNQDPVLRDYMRSRYAY